MQSENGYKTLYCERQGREYDFVVCGTNRASKQENIENSDAVEKKEDNLDFCESIAPEFARRAKREREEEERITECLMKMNDSLGEIANRCEKADQSLKRFEETITSFVPRVERMFWRSAVAVVDADDAAGAADAADTSAAAVCGRCGKKLPLASVKKLRAEQKDRHNESWYEGVVETDSIGNEVGGREREGTLNIRDLSAAAAAERYRTVRESAPSLEPLPVIYFRLGRPIFFFSAKGGVTYFLQPSHSS